MDTKKFWENRLSKEISLRTTGHRAFSLEYNRLFYQAQMDGLDDLIQKNQVELKGSSMLDVGCGGGVFIDYFARKGLSHITGVDITRQSVEYLSKLYPSFCFYEADISGNELPVSGPFRLITAISVMFHIVDQSKFHNALRNMGAMLEPGGYLIICDTFSKSWLPEPKHVHNRPLADYETVLKEQGLQIVDLLPLFYFLNRVYIPWVGPWIINKLKLGPLFYRLDTRLRQLHKSNGDGTKFLLARKLQQP